jgi:hypothetical protein
MHVCDYLRERSRALAPTRAPTTHTTISPVDEFKPALSL